MVGIAPYLAAAAAAAGVAGLLFLVFLLVPVGAPTVHEAPRERIVRSPGGTRPPFADRLAGRAPRGYIGWVERQIVYAGRASDWTAGGFVALKVAVALVGITLAVLWFASAPALLSPVLRIGLGVVLVLIALVGPEIVLSGRADARQKEIQLALPDTLDQMTIAVEAGLGFDAAMAKAAQNGRGPLSDELIHTIQDMAIGLRRREAYAALQRRTNSEDLRRFIRAIVQADAYGISIVDVLRVQASEMRMKRRQRAEEKAMSVPVKLVFPLVFCILPVLFIVLLTPAVISAIDAFS